MAKIEKELEEIKNLINVEISFFYYPELVCLEGGQEQNRDMYMVTLNDLIEELKNLSANQRRNGYKMILHRYILDTGKNQFTSEKYRNEISNDFLNLPQLMANISDEIEEYWFWHSVFNNISKGYILENFYSGLDASDNRIAEN
ncbi:hypothetical protein [Cytobacillus massiliigabonensis]|uniref:hypothetical protein n=1 Tax=Cytobacillus massiliigabonensis TaxID=1871011 RepID=UPI001159503B|nr:hypothetical protein [Cytobacillus massiliigabonensis]